VGRCCYLWMLCSGDSLWRARKDSCIGWPALRSVDVTYSRKMKIAVLILGLFLSPFSLANECLALNIYFESRGESVAGQLAVGHVTLNRVASSKFPNTICDVVYQATQSPPLRWKCQFSWFCDGVRELVSDKAAYDKAVKLSEYLLEQRPLDITEGALWYHAKNVRPHWSWSFRVTTVIDDHIFYTQD